MRRTILFSTMMWVGMSGLTGCSNGLPIGSWGGGSTPFSTPAAAPPAANQNSSWLSPKATMSKMSSTVNSGMQKASGTLSSVAGKLTPKATTIPADDPTSLNSQVTAVGSELHVSAAALYEAQGNFAAANEQYQRAIKATPNDPAVWLGYARSQARQNKLNEAVQSYQQAIKLDPNNAAAWSDLGMCQLQLGQAPAAMESVGRAAQLQPTNQLYRTNMARILVQSGRHEEALAQLNGVMTSAYAHYHLGYLLYERGDTAGATQQFGMAAQLDPNLAQARQMLQTVQGQVQGQVQGVTQQITAANEKVQAGIQQYQAVSQQFRGPGGQVPPAAAAAPGQPGTSFAPYNPPAVQ